MPILNHDIERRGPRRRLKVDVTTHCKELCCDGSMSILGRDEQRCVPRRQLGIDVTAISNELFRDGIMTFGNRAVERCRCGTVCVPSPTEGRCYNELQ
jgi:hypothetical protein